MPLRLCDLLIVSGRHCIGRHPVVLTAMKTGSETSSEEEDLSRFASVAVSSEFVTAAASIPSAKNIRGKSGARLGLRDESTSLGIVENKLYDALAARLDDDSGCEPDALRGTRDSDRSGSDSGTDSLQEYEARGSAPQSENLDSRDEEHSAFQIFKGAPKGKPVTFLPVEAEQSRIADVDDDGDGGAMGSPKATSLSQGQPTTRRERVRAMKQETRRQRKALEKAAKAEAAAAKEAAVAGRRGKLRLPPPPPPLPLEQNAAALTAANASSAHFGIDARPEEFDGGTIMVTRDDEKASRPRSLAEAVEMGVEVTDEERKAFKRKWRIAKNERRKARSAVGRAARQLQKAAHHQVKHKIKKEKQARRDRTAQRGHDAAAAAAANPAGVVQPSLAVPQEALVSGKASNLAKGAAGKSQAVKVARKKISVKRGKFSKQRCIKRNKQLMRDRVVESKK